MRKESQDLVKVWRCRRTGFKSSREASDCVVSILCSVHFIVLAK